MRSVFILVLALAAPASLAAATADGDGPEDQQKAAAILSFLRFTDWNVASREPLVVGLMGRPRFLSTVTRGLAGRFVGGRPVVVRALGLAAEARSCSLVYFATGKKQDVVAVVEQVRGLPVLLLGESDDFLDLGGTATLFFKAGRLSFEVSLPAMDAAGTTISAKLLRLGQVRRNIRAGSLP